MQDNNRRYDIDWLRVIAIGLLLVYHVAIGFQPWGMMIGFITNNKPWSSLWITMAMLNVWRIPFLFFVSGMGVFFAMQKRNWKQLIKERTMRIWLPFVFGMFCIVPVSILIFQYYYHWKLNYSFNPGHLWFLGNIFAYVLLLSPIFYLLKNKEDGKIVKAIKFVFSNPIGLIIVAATFVMEERIVQPHPYEMYAMTWHGFFLGMIAFFFGFCFVLSGEGFTQMLIKGRWVFLLSALGFFTARLIIFNLLPPGYLLVIESQCWIYSVFAFGFKYLNRQGRALRYLSEAAYPIYIIHMIFLYLGSLILFPLNTNPHLEYFLLLAFTLVGCFAFYEFAIRRINMIRPLFGLK